jgi:glycosyltransferase involved in cell wall biosynthesis
MRRPRRILFLNTVGIVGGQEVVMLDILRGLDPNDYACVAACLMPGPLVDELGALGVRTYVLPPHRIRQPLTLARALVALARILFRERIELVHCNGDGLLLYGALSGSLRRTPCVWHVYEPVNTGSSAYSRFFYLTQRRLRPAWTIFGTAAVEPSYLEHYPRLGPHTAIMPGVDVDALNRGADAEAARRRLGIPDGAPVLLLIGRIQRSKGQRELVEAVSRLRGNFAPPHVVLCGGPALMTDEDFPDEIMRLAAELGLSDRVHATGHVSDDAKRDLLAAATVLVHPAHREAFGIAVIEGMAAGKPVVVSDSVGPTSIVAGSGAGEIVPARDVAALAEALKRRLENPIESAEMGAAGQRRVRERYSTAQMVRSVESIYRKLLGEASGDRLRPAH